LIVVLENFSYLIKIEKKKEWKRMRPLNQKIKIKINLRKLIRKFGFTNARHLGCIWSVLCSSTHHSQ
jgi:hypothetical protein